METLEESNNERKADPISFLHPGDIVIDKGSLTIGIVADIKVKEEQQGSKKGFVEIDWMSDLEKMPIEHGMYMYIPLSQWSIERLTSPRGINVNKDYSIERPKHYSENDPFKIMEDNCTFEERMGAAKLNVVKYALRKKNQDKEDWEKIIHYAEWALKQY